jgi:hypothetical protein
MVLVAQERITLVEDEGMVMAVEDCGLGGSGGDGLLWWSPRCSRL